MKQVIGVLASILICGLFLTGCAKEIEKWDCTVTIPANSDEIVLHDTLIQTTTGELSVQNQSNLDFTLFLFDNADTTAPLHEVTIGVGGGATMYQLKDGVDDRVGARASVAEDRELKLIVSDLPNPDPFIVNE